jgi:hypothetical protein
LRSFDSITKDEKRRAIVKGSRFMPEGKSFDLSREKYYYSVPGLKLLLGIVCFTLGHDLLVLSDEVIKDVSLFKMFHFPNPTNPTVASLYSNFDHSAGGGSDVVGTRSQSGMWRVLGLAVLGNFSTLPGDPDI